MFPPLPSSSKSASFLRFLSCSCLPYICLCVRVTLAPHSVISIGMASLAIRKHLSSCRFLNANASSNVWTGLLLHSDVARFAAHRPTRVSTYHSFIAIISSFSISFLDPLLGHTLLLVTYPVLCIRVIHSWSLDLLHIDSVAIWARNKFVVGVTSGLWLVNVGFALYSTFVSS